MQTAEDDWMGVGEDWLEGADVATSTESADAAPIEVEAAALPVVHVERNAVIAEAWARLTPLQRRFLEVAEKNRFNIEATRRARGSWVQMACPARETVSRWKRDPAFKLIFNVLRSAAAHEALNKDDIVVNAAAIRDLALKPKPILYQGAPTGIVEVQGDVALRANEQLAKLGGHLKQEEMTQGQQGPALLVQIIQGEGRVIDVTPRGTVIDLPPPDVHS